VRVLLDVSAVPSRPVGAGVYTIALARGLHGQPGIDLALVARRGDADRWQQIALGAVLRAFGPGALPSRLLWEQAGAPALARRAGADIWHGPHYTLPLRVDLPTVVTVHDMTFFDHPEWHERAKVPFFRRMIKASTARAAAIVCVSNETAQRVHDILNPRAPIVVAHHGVDHDRFHPGATDDAGAGADLAALATHGITPPYVASHPGTMEPRKDIPTLIAAFARIAATRPDLRLVIAGGTGWAEREVREAIAGSGIATRVVRPGYLPSAVLPALLRRADAVAYPSRYEGFGLPALEALACGAPLVTTQGSALEEVVGDAALVVPPSDPDALAGALETLLGDRVVAARLRAAGPVKAAPFTWAASIGHHVDAYRLALDSSRLEPERSRS
jgi:glycosyltransferase involved in cell wall biosynthesis